MKQFIEKDFGKILKRNALQMRRLMRELDSDVIRVYDRNLGEIPVTVDLYGQYARITDYSNDSLTDDEIEKISDVVSRNVYVEPQRIIYHKRDKREEKEQHTVTGGEPLTLEVKENGLSFLVDLTSRIDTGLFLDQMPARMALKEGAEGKKVLNLFSYTGSFSVYAAAGGAKEVISVDLSKTYSDWCEENLKRNGFITEQFSMVTMDARAYIAEARGRHESFDIIIFDPPSFSNSRKMEDDFDVQRDYAAIIGELWDLLSPVGILYFSTNLSQFKIHKRDLDGFSVTEVTSDYRAPGFSGKRTGVRNWVLVKQKRYHKGERLDSHSRKDRKHRNSNSSTQQTRNRKDSTGRESYGQRPRYDSESTPPWKKKREFSERGSFDRPRSEGSREPWKRDASGPRDGYSRDARGGEGRDSRPHYKRDRFNDSPRSYNDRPSYRESPRGPRREGASHEEIGSIVWNEDSKPSRYEERDSSRERGEVRGEYRKPFDRGSDDRRPRREFSDRGGDRPYGRGSDDRKPRREFSDRGADRPYSRGSDDRKPRREFSDRGGDRPYSRGSDDRKPRREFSDRGGDRPYGRGSDDRKPRREFSDRGGDRPYGRGSDDRKPRREFSDRGGDRPYGRGSDDRKPRREFSDRGGDRPYGRGSDDRKPRREFSDRGGDRPYGRGSDDRKPRREFSDRGGDRPYGRGSDDRKPRREFSDRGGDRPYGKGSDDRKPRREFSDRGGDRPYGRGSDDRKPRREFSDRGGDSRGARDNRGPREGGGFRNNDEKRAPREPRSPRKPTIYGLDTSPKASNTDEGKE